MKIFVVIGICVSYENPDRVEVLGSYREKDIAEKRKEEEREKRYWSAIEIWEQVLE